MTAKEIIRDLHYRLVEDFYLTNSSIDNHEVRALMLAAAKEIHNLAIDKAAEKINSHPTITDIEGYAIFPELAEAIKELKQ